MTKIMEVKFNFYQVQRMGKNSQISLFFKIISILPLFKKYLVMYHLSWNLSLRKSSTLKNITQNSSLRHSSSMY